MLVVSGRQHTRTKSSYFLFGLALFSAGAMVRDHFKFERSLITDALSVSVAMAPFMMVAFIRSYRERSVDDETATGGPGKALNRFLSSNSKWLGLTGLTVAIMILGIGVYGSQRGPDEKAIRKWNEGSSRQLSYVQLCQELQANPLVYRADRQGHFWLTAIVNGAPVQFVLVTGASQVALTLKDAAAAGISRDHLVFSSRVRTPNGDMWVAPVNMAEMRIEQLSITDIPAIVAEKLDVSLLGMSFLRRLDFGISGDVLTLTCKRAPII